jgi:hypothetical protein
MQEPEEPPLAVAETLQLLFSVVAEQPEGGAQVLVFLLQVPLEQE